MKINKDRQTERHSFDIASPEETVTPPLQIPRLYSSSNPQTPRLRLSTPKPSTLRFTPQSSPLRPSSSIQQAPPVSLLLSASMPYDTTPGCSLADRDDSLVDRTGTPSHQRDGSSAYRRNERSQSSYAASPMPASPTPSREEPGNPLSSILANLVSSVNSLQEEMAETRSAVAAMNSSPNAATGFYVVPGLSHHSPFKALFTPRQKDQGRTDMMVSYTVNLT